MPTEKNFLKNLYHSSRLAHWALEPLVNAKTTLQRLRQEPAIAVIDRLERLSANDICVRVEEFEGVFWLSPASHLLRRVLVDGHYEPLLARIAKDHLDPARDAIDVGANVGFFSVLFGKTLNSGRVLSIEPSASARKRLLANFAQNNVSPSRTVVFGGLVGETDGTGELQVIDGREEYSSAGEMAHPAVRGLTARIETVAKATLDTLVRENHLNPALIKIDIEGFEMPALKGAEWTLRTFRPVVLSELSDPLLRSNGSSSKQLVEYLEGLGYAVVDPLFANLRAGSRPYGDLLAVPR